MEHSFAWFGLAFRYGAPLAIPIIGPYVSAGIAVYDVVRTLVEYPFYSHAYSATAQGNTLMRVVHLSVLQNLFSHLLKDGFRK